MVFIYPFLYSNIVCGAHTQLGAFSRFTSLMHDYHFRVLWSGLFSAHIHTARLDQLIEIICLACFCGISYVYHAGALVSIQSAANGNFDLHATHFFCLFSIPFSFSLRPCIHQKQNETLLINVAIVWISCCILSVNCVSRLFSNALAHTLRARKLPNNNNLRILYKTFFKY